MACTAGETGRWATSEAGHDVVLAAGEDGGGEGALPAREGQHGATGSLDGVRILVVEDDEGILAALGMLLELHGAEVRSAASAAEAWPILRGWKPRVLLSDIGMRSVDGYQLVRKLRATEAASGGRTPAIALTARVRSEDQAEAMASGFDLFLTKPVDPQELARAIATLLAGAGQPPRA